MVSWGPGRTIQVNECEKGAEERKAYAVAVIWKEDLRDTGNRAGGTGQDLTEKGPGKLLRKAADLHSCSMTS